MTRWFPWGKAPEHAQEGDRVWRIGARDQVFWNGLWTLACHRCDVPMTGCSEQGGLACARCGVLFRDIPQREVAP